MAKLGNTIIDGDLRVLGKIIGETSGGSSETAETADKLSTARNINGIAFDGSEDITNFGICNTAIGVAAKEVTISSDFSLVDGAEVTVKFNNMNNANSPSLNVNNTGAKVIKSRGSALNKEDTLERVITSGSTYKFVYNETGDCWELLSDTFRYDPVTLAKNGLMLAEDKVKLDSMNMQYATCDTAANVANKEISIENGPWVNEVGALLVIKFTATNTASNPTFTIIDNYDTGDPIISNIPIWYNQSQITTSNLNYVATANRPALFMFDGNYFVFLGWSMDANTTYSQASLGQGYGTCTTAESTTAKVVTLSSYALATNGIVSVKFTYEVPANATMNINSKGAKPIYYKGSAITAGIIKAGDTATFIYNGTNYHLIAIDRTIEASTQNNNLVNGSSNGSLRSINSSTEDSSYTIGQNAFSEGRHTKAIGISSHAEGDDTRALGESSHTEGESTEASGKTAHAEGRSTNASGSSSHAEGYGTKSSSDYQHVQGKWNVEDTNDKYAHIVGNGADIDNRSNAHTVDWQGNGWFSGELKVGGTSQDDPNAINVLTSLDDNKLKYGINLVDHNIDSTYGVNLAYPVLTNNVVVGEYSSFVYGTLCIYLPIFFSPTQIFEPGLTNKFYTSGQFPVSNELKAKFLAAGIDFENATGNLEIYLSVIVDSYLLSLGQQNSGTVPGLFNYLTTNDYTTRDYNKLFMFEYIKSTNTLIFPETHELVRRVPTEGNGLEYSTAIVNGKVKQVLNLKNASTNEVGGLKVRFDSATGALYMTNDGTNP